ncbi:1-acyl-sn-glycerol-3-phosphate acyltransferase [Ectothiorhodospiraceae bacterium BW-2]|nr:1-acyl-sn-glycerol-3-phosphate acyltransferase [Ectothiorhodospiraceae bacterium BW-2]
MLIVTLTLITLTAAALALYVIGHREHRTDWNHRGLNWLEGINQLFCRRYHRLQAPMLTQLPASGGAVVVCNHLSGLDPMLLIAASPRPLRFLIAREQYRRFGMQWLFRAVGSIPVDRDANPERAYRAAIRALQQGEVIALFPQGGIAPDQQPRPLKPGAWRLAQRSGVPMIVTKVEGISSAAIGHVIRAVWHRGRPKITELDTPLDCRQLDKNQWQQQLNQFWFNAYRLAQLDSHQDLQQRR